MKRTMNLEEITKNVATLCLETGEFLRNEVHKLNASDIETKSSNNFVTYVDKTSEAMLMEGLSKIVPGTGFIAEENPQLQKKELNWIIDPLDGTTNFIHSIPLYSISIALMENHEVLSGVVLEVNQKECFYTWKEAPVFLNGNKVNVSGISQVKDSLFATGFPYYDYSHLDGYIEVLRHLMQHSHGIRRLGSAAADLAYVACGRIEGFYEYGLSPWDVAAGVLLVKNAGGIVTDFSGGNDYIFGKEVIATNPHVHKEFSDIFRNIFYDRKDGGRH
jgi:myo-inositol-1(or 4)-monophosphatase